MTKADAFLFPKFALTVYSAMQKKFSQTYFVGGAVRNALLNKKISDVDIATSATPTQVTKLLQQNKISFSDSNAKFGVIVAQKNKEKIEITTFRKDQYQGSRYPKITFAKNAKTDSLRRDFSINALYYSPAKGELLDFHQGLKDIQRKRIKFIGNANKRINEDPLRIARAYRFKLQYKLSFEAQTAKALQANKRLLKKISKTRLQREINAITSLQLRKTLQKVIHNIT